MHGAAGEIARQRDRRASTTSISRPGLSSPSATSAVPGSLAMAMAAGIAPTRSTLWALASTLPYIQSLPADMDPRGAVVTAGALASSAGGGIGPSATALLEDKSAWSAARARDEYATLAGPQCPCLVALLANPMRRRAWSAGAC
jgi:hypothetical protein